MSTLFTPTHDSFYPLQLRVTGSVSFDGCLSLPPPAELEWTLTSMEQNTHKRAPALLKLQRRGSRRRRREGSGSRRGGGGELFTIVVGHNLYGVMRVPLRWVLWDVKDTLLKVRSSVGEQYCREAERMGLSVSPAEVETAFRQAYRRYSSRYPNYGITQGLDGESWWMGVVRDTFSQCRVQDPALLNKLAQNLYHNFCNAENWEVFPDSKKALESCSSLGLKLGVVSNFDCRLEAILRVCGLRSYFSFLITSEEAGVAKPNPVIFDQALQRCGAAAAGVAHVGDHYVNDYLCPRSVGIHGILLDRHNKQNQPDVPPEHRLSSLEELLSRLQQHMD